MSLYKNNPVTLIELEQWRKNKLINPRSNRKIKTSSPIFKYLHEENNNNIITQTSTIINDEIIVDEEYIEDGIKNDQTEHEIKNDQTEHEIKNDQTEYEIKNDQTETKIKNAENDIIDSFFEIKTVINITIKDDNQKNLNLLKDIQGPLLGKYLNSFDNKDPISQEDIWVLIDGEKKVSDDIPLYKMFSYRDDNGNIRCFNIESIQTMIQSNINKHPITGNDIKKDVIERALQMIKILTDNNILENDIKDDGILTEQKIKEYAFDVFQKFSFISIFIDSEWFLKLQTHELLKLNYELKDFYENNVETNLRKIMVPPNGFAFELTKEDLASKTDNNILEIQKYILENVEKVIGTSSDAAMKNLGNYLMIGGLAIVCPEIRERYPDFVYGFSF